MFDHFPPDVRALLAACVEHDCGGEGHEVRVRIWGTGPEIILLHGGSGSWMHWIRTIPALAAGYRVIVPDIPGFGSSELPADLSFDGVRQVLEDAISQCRNRDSFALAGFSLGGKLAISLAARFTSQVTHLAVAGVSFADHTLEPPKLERRDGDLPADARSEVARRNLVRMMFASEHSADELACWIDARHHQDRRMRRRDLQGSPYLDRDLPRVTAPLRAILGSADWITGNAHEQRRALDDRAISRTSLTLLDGASHWVMYEQADAFNTWLMKVLQAK